MAIASTVAWHSPTFRRTVAACTATAVMATPAQSQHVTRALRNFNSHRHQLEELATTYDAALHALRGMEDALLEGQLRVWNLVDRNVIMAAQKEFQRRHGGWDEPRLAAALGSLLSAIVAQAEGGPVCLSLQTPREFHLPAPPTPASPPPRTSTLPTLALPAASSSPVTPFSASVPCSSVVAPQPSAAGADVTADVPVPVEVLPLQLPHPGLESCDRVQPCGDGNREGDVSPHHVSPRDQSHGTGLSGNGQCQDRGKRYTSLHRVAIALFVAATIVCGAILLFAPPEDDLMVRLLHEGFVAGAHATHMERVVHVVTCRFFTERPVHIAQASKNSGAARLPASLSGRNWCRCGGTEPFLGSLKGRCFFFVFLFLACSYHLLLHNPSSG